MAPWAEDPLAGLATSGTTFADAGGAASATTRSQPKGRYLRCQWTMATPTSLQCCHCCAAYADVLADLPPSLPEAASGPWSGVRAAH